MISFKASLVAEEAMMLSSLFFVEIDPRPLLNDLFMTYFDFNALGTVVCALIRYVFFLRQKYSEKIFRLDILLSQSF